MNPTPISEHEGNKYVRTIWSIVMPPDTQLRVVDLGGGYKSIALPIDVYCVLNAFPFARENTEVGHAVKKLLMAGDRGKGDAIADLRGVLAAVSRAIERLEIESAAEKKTVVDNGDAPSLYDHIANAFKRLDPKTATTPHVNEP